MSKILCLIDSLGSGGAERQISYLCAFLQKFGHEVKLVAFTRNNKFYEAFLLSQGIEPIYNENGINKFRRIWEISKLVRTFQPDLVVAYKDGVCISAILAKLFINFNLCVSERTTTFKLSNFDKIKFFLYRYANYIVPNSNSQAQFIASHYPKLANKIKTIRNTIDTDLFFPANYSLRKIKRIITTATIYKAKNTRNLVIAASILKKQGIKCQFEWYGKRFAYDDYPDKIEELIRDLGVDDMFILRPPSQNVVEVYNSGDIFCLPSLVEGFPNVICEAMSCGLPVVCSDICDNPDIVSNGINGYTFNPDNPEDIADKIKLILSLSYNQLQAMGIQNREKIKTLCAPTNFVKQYIELI